MRERVRLRIDQQTESEREARLVDMSTRVRQSTHQETESERETRLADNYEHKSSVKNRPGD